MRATHRAAGFVWYVAHHCAALPLWPGARMGWEALGLRIVRVRGLLGSLGTLAAGGMGCRGAAEVSDSPTHRRPPTRQM